MSAKEKIVLFACGGDLPQQVAETLKADQKNYAIIGFKGHTDPEWLSQHPSEIMPLGQIGGILKRLKKLGATSILFAGHIRRPSWSELSLDLTGLWWLWQFKRQKKQGDDALLTFIAKKLESRGYQVLGAQDIHGQALTRSGAYTKQQPTQEQWRDIKRGASMAKKIGELDIGQAIVIQQGIILGVEAIEGTGALIDRTRHLKRQGNKPMLVKMSKPQQDQRVDLPTIGDKTVQQVIDAGFAGIAIEAGKSFFLNQEQATALADKNGVFIVALDSDDLSHGANNNG